MGLFLAKYVVGFEDGNILMIANVTGKASDANELVSVHDKLASLKE